MPQPNQRPQVSRHVSAASVDTNASAIAESTISLGLSRFPEPPSSIPSTPTRSNFNSPSSSLRNYHQPNTASATPLWKIKSQEKAHNLAKSPIPSSNSGPSFKPTHRPAAPPDPPQPSSSSHIISAYDWHDGASSIAVDAAEDRLLPTSFITSLLQENQKLSKSKRGSYGSDAFSGISEMTYPPLVNRPANYDSRPPPSSYNPPPASIGRISGDSDTLHSLQTYPSVTSTSNVAKPGTQNSMVGVTSPILHSGSNSSQISSTRDSDTLGSVTQGYQRKLSTAYESGEETSSDYKTFSHLTTTAGPQRRPLQESSQQEAHSRQSVHSHRSVAPSFMSRMSGLSLGRVFNWRRAKPLPPVPKIPDISLAAENAYRKEEENTPLPDLVNRAGVLRELLDRGQHPHHSLNLYQVLPASVDPSMSRGVNEAEARNTKYSSFPGMLQPPPLRKEEQPTSMRTNLPKGASLDIHKRKWLWVVLTIAGVILLVAIGVGVGLTVGKKKNPVESNCTGNFVGSSCSLDASCVCTSASGCNGLAQSIVNLLPTVNQVFDTNITSALAYSSIWIMQGSPTTRSCKSQALLIDVGINLDQAKFPNRTQWAQVALLWNAIQTQSMPSAQQMQAGVQALPWENIASTDGPVEADAFSITSSGFIFNFASQSLSQPSASFLTLGPSTAQIARISPSTNATLNRMYTYALASSTQRQTALAQYWTSVLLRRPEDLVIFKTAISASPIMLPFDAFSSAVRSLYVSSPSSSFPPPLSCFPELGDSLLQAINTVESNAFGLQTASKTDQFNPQCYPDRPVYGVLNILRLRLPFLDSETGVDRQAVVLTKDASVRAILYNGQLFSTISNTSAPFPGVSSVQSNPLQFGTIDQLDHVILQYLSSIPDINTANNLIQFVLNTTNTASVPPDTTSPLFNSLSVLPSLGVAVFGAVQSADLTSTVSPFITPSNSLFFGSPDGSALRNWTINSSSGSIIWTQNATSALVAHDSSLDAQASISKIWEAASLAIAFNVTSITLGNITRSLQGTDSLTSQ